MTRTWRSAVWDAGRLPLVGTLVSGAYRRYFDAASARHTRLFHGVFADFAAAEAAIPAGRNSGYDNSASAGRVIGEWLDVYPSDYPVLLWLSKLVPDCKLLFDWGGNVGLKYFAFRRYLTYPESFTWLVNDVPAVVELGRVTAKREAATARAEAANARGETPTAQHGATPELRFTSTLEELPVADVLLAAGALHFIDDAFGKLASLPNLPEHLIFSKVPAHDAPSVWTLHNMGTAMCPYRLFNRDELVRAVEDLGYRLIDEWRMPDVFCEIPFFPKYKIEAYSGFYFARNALPAGEGTQR